MFNFHKVKDHNKSNQNQSKGPNLVYTLPTTTLLGIVQNNRLDVGGFEL